MNLVNHSFINRIRKHLKIETFGKTELTLNQFTHLRSDDQNLEVLEPHLNISTAMKLKSEFSGFFALRINNINDTETVEEGCDVIATGTGANSVPVLIGAKSLVTNLFNEVFVVAKPATSRGFVARLPYRFRQFHSAFPSATREC